jgi:hypothetical protein
MASALAAGHGGIFEVSLDGSVAYTNRGAGCSIPGDDEVVAALKAALG